MFAYVPSIITVLAGLVAGAFALTRVQKPGKRVVPLLAVIGVVAVGVGWFLQTTVTRHASSPIVAQLYPENLRMGLLVGGGLLASIMALVVFIAYYTMMNKTAGGVTTAVPTPAKAPAYEPETEPVAV